MGRREKWERKEWWKRRRGRGQKGKEARSEQLMGMEGEIRREKKKMKERM